MGGSRRTWRWAAVGASVLIIGVPVAFMGLYATGDLCEPPYGSRDSQLKGERYENVVETVVVRCFAEYRDGTEVEETRINWLGGGGALFFLIAVFFGSAAVVGVLSRKPAAAAAAISLTICLALVVIWFS